MRGVYLLIGTGVVLLAFLGSLPAGGQHKPRPPKKPAPSVHHSRKPVPNPKHARPPSRPKPHQKVYAKVTPPPKPLARPVVHHPTGPKYREEAKKRVAALAYKKKSVHKDRKLAHGITGHWFHTRWGEREFRVHKFHEFHRERREYWFSSYWWRRFVTGGGGASPGASVGAPGGFFNNGSQAASFAPGTPAAADMNVPIANLPFVNSPAVINLKPTVIRVNQGLPMSASGRDLAAAIDGLDVENHWLAGQRVDWRTGNPVDDNRPGTTSNGGAFVAAVAARFGVPMPTPEAANFLDGEQVAWLLDKGIHRGWVLLGDVEAQLLANQGWVVIAAWSDPNPASERKTAGVLAVVRPDSRSVGTIEDEGPRVALAAQRNRSNIGLYQMLPTGEEIKSEIVYLAHKQQ